MRKVAACLVVFLALTDIWISPCASQTSESEAANQFDPAPKQLVSGIPGVGFAIEAELLTEHPAYQRSGQQGRPLADLLDHWSKLGPGLACNELEVSDVSLEENQRHIFVSYSWHEKELVKELCAFLKKEKYKVWVDLNKQRAASQDDMEKAVTYSALVILCVSETYTRSFRCNEEATYANKLGKRCVPVVMDARFDPTEWMSEVARDVLRNTTQGNFLRIYKDSQAKTITTDYTRLLSRLNDLYESIGKQEMDDEECIVIPVYGGTGTKKEKLSEDNAKNIQKMKDMLKQWTSEFAKSPDKADTKFRLECFRQLLKFSRRSPENIKALEDFLVEMKYPGFIMTALEEQWPKQEAHARKVSRTTENMKENQKEIENAKNEEEGEDEEEEATNDARGAEKEKKASSDGEEKRDREKMASEAEEQTGMKMSDDKSDQEANEKKAETGSNGSTPKDKADSTYFDTALELCMTYCSKSKQFATEIENIKDSTKYMAAFMTYGASFKSTKINSLKVLYFITRGTKRPFKVSGLDISQFLRKHAEPGNGDEDMALLSMLLLAHMDVSLDKDEAAEILKNLFNKINMAVTSNETLPDVTLWDLLLAVSKYATKKDLKHLIYNKLKQPIRDEDSQEREPLVNRLMKTDDDKVKLATSDCIWRLAFDNSIRRELFKNQALLEILKITKRETSNAALKKKLVGAVWEITSSYHVVSQPNGNLNPEGHVFISYCWNEKNDVRTLHAIIKKTKVKVWIDSDKMQGSTLEAMAKAVQNAAVVIICMSSGYQNSKSCRTEGEYTYKLNKKIIPIKMKKEFEPSDWLGAMIGTRLWFRFSEIASIGETKKKFLAEMKQAYEQYTSTNDKAQDHQEDPDDAMKKLVTRLTREDVEDLLIAKGFNPDPEKLPEKLRDIDGQQLWQLWEIKREYKPTEYERTLRRHMELKMEDILKLYSVFDYLQDIGV